MLKRMFAHAALVLCAIGLLVALSGCDQRAPAPTPTPALTPTLTPDTAASFPTISAGLDDTPTPHLFGGSGDQTSDTFSLSKGTARITLTHAGSLNFIVELLNSDGSVAELLVNQAGPYDGSTVVNIPAPATYILKVQADGEWIVSIEQGP